MQPHDWLADRFEARRTRLRAVAFRMLGSLSEAEDAVQEAWLHASRAGAADVDNVGGWLTTIVARVCLDMLRARKARREDARGEPHPEPVAPGGPEQERERMTADSVGLALLVVLETLDPAERIAFVLHDMFDVPFEEIAPIVGRSPAAARQLASRGRRRVQGKATPVDVDAARREAVVDAFLAAARAGSFEALLAVLDPDVVVRADATAARLGADPVQRGAAAAAGTFKGRAGGARPALVDGAAAAVWAPGGKPRVVFLFTVTGDRVAAIDLVADAERLSAMELEILEGEALR
jgi:RNA polymerase sigma factor (sigma-70 family)